MQSTNSKELSSVNANKNEIEIQKLHSDVQCELLFGENKIESPFIEPDINNNNNNNNQFIHKLDVISTPAKCCIQNCNENQKYYKPQQEMNICNQVKQVVNKF